MVIEIYYFTGTGNSLVIARNLAEQLDANLLPIASMMESEEIEPKADTFGLVFPIYFGENDSGIPRIIAKFIQKLKNIDSKYIFAVCTYGYIPGSTIGNVNKAIKIIGGTLAGGFLVKMCFRKVSPKKTQKMRDNWQKKLKYISDYIKTQKKGKFETRSFLRKVLFAPFMPLIGFIFKFRYKRLANVSNLPFTELVPLADRTYRINEKCNGCGICSRVCPVDNIKMIDKRPIWQHHCENCYACFQWCPQEAIYGDIVSWSYKYHNPDVKLADILKQKNKPD